ncbi:hypothetical protein KUTeg_003038 [Tegillarca granosa]|uniref:NADH dehydrogenase [ubiquinone] 1 alpha subcomplex subunit 6 n=1 Tax=Tegillarca granosa TaxID=220873 RepID=A0ABQ9FKY4_TEGGR|nr:hypothetical protein KUTeg_003038 [Tegillarca granosa]
MAANKVVREGMKQVKPILSVDRTEARRRVLNLYKAWYRQMPFIVKEFDMPVSVSECRAKLRQKFLATRHVTDVRAIDIMVIKIQNCQMRTVAFPFVTVNTNVSDPDLLDLLLERDLLPE